MGITVLSLFDGISCGYLALERAGIDVDRYYASEIDRNAIEISEKNYAGKIIRLGDINGWEKWKLEKIDLIIGGSPCQGFSRNGIGLNFEDTRSKLFFVFAEILQEVKVRNPEILFLLENVEMKKEWENIITQTIGAEPTKINSKLLSAQSRPRIYWQNIRQAGEAPKDAGIKLKDILENPRIETIEENGLNFDKSICKQQREIAERTQDGNAKIKQATKAGYIIAEPYDGVNLQMPKSKTRRGRVIKGKSSTVDTAADICVFTGNAIRKFTLVELERLQTLPDGYTEADGITDSERKKAIGNGWTVDIISFFFKGIKEGRE